MKIVKAVAQGKVLCVFFIPFPLSGFAPGARYIHEKKNFYDVTPAAIRSGNDHSNVGGRKKQGTKGTREEGETKTSGK